MHSNLSVIILAAGKGTRMKTELPKVLCRTVAGPMIDVVIKHAQKLSPYLIYIVTGYKNELVESSVLSTFDTSKEKFRFIKQEVQKGTGHAVQVVAQSSMFQGPHDEDILILYGDTPLLGNSLLTDFYSFHKKTKADLSLISVNEVRANTFGRVVRRKDSTVEKIVEAKDCSPEQLAIKEVNSGIYLVKRSVLVDKISLLQNNNVQKEYYLTDLIELCSSSMVVEAYTAASFKEVMGVNDLFDLLTVNKIIMNEKIKSLIASGVTFIDEATVYIDPSVTIGVGSIIGPNVQIKGDTQIGDHVIIEGTAFIQDSHIGNNCTIKLGARIEGSTFSTGVSVGPFVNIRPDTILKADVKIGNFVETKKSTLHEHVKVNHLSYIGDATIGKETNIGAGTITCNYDGYKKSQTTVGERVFIGSNSSLVAPVTIESDTTIGAGSVITKKVSAGSLAVTRAQQTEVAGWTTKKRKA